MHTLTAPPKLHPPMNSRRIAPIGVWVWHLGLAGAIATGVGVATAAPAQISPFLKVDQFGYLPDSRKLAIVADPQAGSNAAAAFAPGTGVGQYEVRRWEDDRVVLRATLQTWRAGATHFQSGDRGWWLDFSSVKTPGAYYLYDSVRRLGSGRFDVGPKVYDEVLRQALRVFYHQRLGVAHPSRYAGARWADAASYQGAQQDRFATSRHAKGDARTARDLRGGWMDAGDTNKYTTFAQSAVLQLLEAYRLSPQVFTDALGIPESGNGLPDVLDELKWELAFLQRMQDATGTHGLLLKVGVDTDEGSASPPSSDTRPRYYLPECTSATLAGSAMLAAGAVVYRGIASQQTYGNALLARAQAAWQRAKVTTHNFSTYQTECDDGHIRAGDADVSATGQLASALTAAVYLYEATGKAEYRQFVEQRYTQAPPYSDTWWGPYGHAQHLALLRYAGLPGVSATVAANIRRQKQGMNGVMSIDDDQAGTDLYRAHLPDAQYHWGHNQVRANVGNLNLDFIQFGLNPTQHASYRAIAEQHLHWLHGANPLGLVMLSNMNAYGAESSVRQIYHTWFTDGSVWDDAQTSPKGPPPGYVTGGPNKGYSGPVAGITDQPPQKAYRDWNAGWPENAWELSEPAIYTQAAYVMLLSRIIASQGSTPVVSDTEPPSAPGAPVVSARTAQGFSLSWTASTDDTGVTAYDVYNGTTLLRAGLTDTRVTLSDQPCARSFTLRLAARDAAGNTSAFGPATATSTLACQAQGVYTDTLGSGWRDWSWNATRQFNDTTHVHTGTQAIRVDLNNWGGLSLRHDSGWSTTGATLRFWVYSPQATPLRLYTQSSDDGGDSASIHFSTLAGQWQQVSVPMSQLGNPGWLKRLNLQLASAGSGTIYVDQIELLR